MWVLCSWSSGDSAGARLWLPKRTTPSLALSDSGGGLSLRPDGEQPMSLFQRLLTYVANEVIVKQVRPFEIACRFADAFGR